MQRRTRLRVLAGSLVLVAGLSTAAGCGDDDDVVVDSDRGKVSVDADGDTVTVETDDGSATVGAGLPDGFPVDDVPLIDEDVITGAEGEPGGDFAWSVILQTSRAIDDVTAEVKRDFADAGYTEGAGTAAGDVSILQFESDEYEVGVTAARTAGSVTVTYVVRVAG